MQEYEEISKEQWQNFIAFNLNAINEIPERFETLIEMVKPVYKDLLDLMNYISKLDVFRFNGRYTFVLPNTILTANVREKTTASATSRHYSYLCALGLLRVETSLTQVNKNFLKKSGSRRPIKQMSMPKYTADQMANANSRAEQLKAAGVTAGNISHDKLYLNDLQEMALEVYPANDVSTAKRRLEEWDTLCAVIDDLIADKGYTTKADIYADARFGFDAMRIGRKEIDMLFRIFSKQIAGRYKYARPTNAEKEGYNLCNDKYILTKR